MQSSTPTLRGRTAAVVLALAALGIASMPAQAAPDYFKQDVLANVQRAAADAIAIVSYSSKVTNENTGAVQRRDRSALALIVSRDGLVMTHGHMVTDNSEPFNIKVTVGQGDDEEEYEATLLQKPEDVNIVFLRLQSDTPLSLPFVRFAQRRLENAQPVAAIGVLSETHDHARTVLELRVGAILDDPRRTYCVDRNLSFGYVGGPVYDTTGTAVGVVGYDLSRNEGGDLYVRSGHPLIYQTKLFQQYIDEPPSETEELDTADDAWLGVFTQPLTDDLAAYWNLDRDGGLVISTVVPGSPAADAGLTSGDIIVNFNGTPIRAKRDREVLGFTKLVRETGPGQTVPVDILRDGDPKSVSVDLAQRPRMAGDANMYEDPVFGMTVGEITTDLRIRFNLASDVQGVIVRKVESGSVAQAARIRPRVILLALGDYPVRSIEEYKQAVERLAEEKPEEVAVFARAGAATGFFRLQPRWNGQE